MPLARRLVLLWVMLVPSVAAAGGNEFPAGGTRNLGRGGTGLTRADDPNVMVRNPALLADLWTSMASTGVHLLLADSCFQATGSYGWNVQNAGVVNFGDGPLVTNVSGARGSDGEALPDLGNQAFPKVCYRGPSPMVVPAIGLALKLAPDLGLGFGFFPPESASLGQWGNRDGTIDTANGLRPSPTRWFQAHQNSSYVSALVALGYRPLDWLRVGVGLQWAIIAYSSTNFARAAANLNPDSDVRVDVDGSDLFIPGFVASAQATPLPSLDVALGFRWSDRVKTNARLDITTNNFGGGDAFSYMDAAGEMVSPSVLRPTRTENLRGSVDLPPMYVPQLSLGVRYADRILSRPSNERWALAKRAAGRDVQDAMATERWDIEANAVVYFNAANDVTRIRLPDRKLPALSVAADGSEEMTEVSVGECVSRGSNACVRRELPSYLHGKTQISLRLGGEYNIILGMLAVRAGVSYESNGQNVQDLNVTNYQLGRTGLHVGATWRIASTTDLSIAYAHFIQRRVALTVNDKSPFETSQPGKFHVVRGENDGMAHLAIADSEIVGEGPLFANAGTFYYHLDVLSVSVAQHF